MADIASDIAAYVESKEPETCRSWFAQRPELTEAVARQIVEHGAKIVVIYDYLVERHQFPYGLTAFKQIVRTWAGRKKVAA